MAGIDDLLGLGAPGGNVFNIVQGDGSSLPPMQQQQAAAAYQQPAYQAPHGIRAFLGKIGDALLVANGAQPIHQQNADDDRVSSALSGFLTSPDQSIQQLMGIPGHALDAIKLYSAIHSKQVDPETIQLMRAAGIDPASDEGKQFIRDKLSGGGGADPSSVREYQFAKQQGFAGSYMDFMNQRGGPLVANNGDGTFTIVPRAMVPTGGSGSPVTATGKDGTKIQYDPTTHSWKPAGGQTPTASGNFPGR